MSANSIQAQLQELDVDQINVHIDSYGGAVSEGWAIYNALVNHPAKIVTYGDGFVASAALYPFLAGEERYANSLSAYYMHQVIVTAQGYASDLRAAADEADFFTDLGIQAFTERTQMDEATVRQLMESETWLTPMEALAYGLATGVLNESGPKYGQDVKEQIMRQMCPKWTPCNGLEKPETPEKTPEKNNILKLFERS